MKKEGHPEYQETLFVDTATGVKFVCGSTLKTGETDTFEGKEYPVYRASVSSTSHPFFTGSQQFVDTEGRVDKFRKRYARPAASAKKDDQGEGEGKEQKGKKRPPRKKAEKK